MQPVAQVVWQPLLKVISILCWLLSRSFAIGYFLSTYFWMNNRKVPVVITGFVNPTLTQRMRTLFWFTNLIRNGQTQIDTTTMDYHKSLQPHWRHHPVECKRYWLPLDVETISRMKNAAVYLRYRRLRNVSGRNLWLVTLFSKHGHLPEKLQGRYMK